MAKYRQTAHLLNRTRTVGKYADGGGLFFMRNRDGSLTAWQRVMLPGGKSREERLGVLHEEITPELLEQIRTRGRTLKAGVQGGELGRVLDVPTLEKLWGGYYAAVTTAANPKWAPSTAKDIKRRVELWVAGTPIWKTRVDRIDAPALMAALKPLKEARPKLFPSVLTDLRAALHQAVVAKTITANPVEQLRESLRITEKPVTCGEHAAVTSWVGLGEVLKAIKSSDLGGSVRAALLLQAYTCQRSGEIAGGRWEEYDESTGTWTIPRSRMKEKKGRKLDHVLVLPEPARQLLKGLPRRGVWMFPQRDPEKAICPELLPQGLVRLGHKGKHTPHGWRSSLTTLAQDAVDDDERPLFHPRWTEDVLDHVDEGTRSHYNRDKATRGVATVLAWWAAQLEEAAK
jgi:integrase